jgi:hypothetical protein
MYEMRYGATVLEGNKLEREDRHSFASETGGCQPLGLHEMAGSKA